MLGPLVKKGDVMTSARKICRRATAIGPRTKNRNFPIVHEQASAWFLIKLWSGRQLRKCNQQNGHEQHDHNIWKSACKKSGSR